MTAAPSAGFAVIVAAAGRGQRLGDEQPKAFARLGSMTVLEHCLTGLLLVDQLTQVVVAVPASHVGQARTIRASFPSLNIEIVVGGPDRSATIAAAVERLDPATSIVLVHDAARPFTPAEVFDRVYRAVEAGNAAVVPVVPIVDTVRRVDSEHRCHGTVDRAELRSVQTPQGFRFLDLRDAHRAVIEVAVTDDAALMEHFGHEVVAVPGDRRSFKVTEPFDKLIATTVAGEQAVRN